MQVAGPRSAAKTCEEVEDEGNDDAEQETGAKRGVEPKSFAAIAEVSG